MKQAPSALGTRRTARTGGIRARNRILRGDCIQRMRQLPENAVDLIVTDPPYLVGYRDRDGRSIANDRTGEWLKPAFEQMYRLLKPDSYCVVFYGWHAVDQFMAAWKAAG